MATWEEVLLKARELAQTTEQKTAELVNKTRIKMEISELQKQLAATFEGIGRLEYEAALSGEDIAELKEEAFKTVKLLQKRIDVLQDRLYGMQGAVRCKECGVINDGDADFCKKCGKAV